MIENQHIICFSTEDWNPLLPTNKYQLMSRLSEKNKILYIETLGTRRPQFNFSDVSRITKRLFSQKKTSDAYRDSVSVLSPRIIPSHTNFFRKINSFLFAPILKKHICKNNIKNPIVWIYNPYAVYYLDAIKDPSLIIYHCVDDLSAVPGANKQEMIKAEEKLLKRSNIVFATANNLYEKCKKINPNTFLQTNVSDFNHFNTVDKQEFEKPSQLENLKKPILMFSGNLARHKVDYKLIKYIALSRPDWTLVIIGPKWEGDSSEEFESMTKIKNIKYIGYIAYLELPRYFKYADILFIPYVKNKATENVFPLKFYEYLATGKPVICTDLGSLQEKKGLIPLTDDHDQYVKECEKLLLSADENKGERIKCASENTWEKRIDQMSEIINSFKKM